MNPRHFAVPIAAWIAWGAGGCAAPRSRMANPPPCAPAGIAPVQQGPGYASEIYPSSLAGGERWMAERYASAPALTVLQGQATYYADSLAGNRTASGERYDPRVFTAAHRTLPFGTIVRVIRTDSSRFVYVRVTDRGPFAGRQRIIDLSRVAAESLDMIRAGVVDVRVEVVEYPR